MENIPGITYLLFGATVLLALWLFVRAAHYSVKFSVLISAWLAFQSILGIFGFYNAPGQLTTRFPLLVVPPVILITLLFATSKGRRFIDGLDLKALTIFHVIRIPVEFVLLMLFIQHMVPRAMSFEGRNLDILSGLSAPIIYYFFFSNKKLNRTGLLIWNMVCILLLLNVVSSAVLSLPGRFRRFSFEQANIALGFFPFLLLPACLVPMVLFANLAAIRQLTVKKKH